MSQTKGLDRCALIDFLLYHFEGEQLPVREESKSPVLAGKTEKGWADEMIDPRSLPFCGFISLRFKEIVSPKQIADLLNPYFNDMEWHTDIGVGISGGKDYECGNIMPPELLGIQMLGILVIRDHESPNVIHISFDPIVC